MNISNKKTFSIITPVYYNELNIPHTVTSLLELQEKLTDYQLELIFVDDGSRDNSFSTLLTYKKKNKCIKIVKLSRNFGSMAAVQAGLKFSRGDCVGIIAADLQEPPELFIEMIKFWEKGKKTVMAVRSDREDPFLQKIFSKTYYFLMDKFALSNYPRGGFDFILVDRQIVDEVNKISEKNTNIMSLIFWLGYENECIPYVRRKRVLGKSKWTLTKKIKLFIDSFVSFSFMPIRLISLTGLITAILSFTYGTYVVVVKLFFNVEIEGWASIIALISFLLGMIMFMLGIIGEYLWRILDETRKRPAYIIDEIFE